MPFHKFTSHDEPTALDAKQEADDAHHATVFILFSLVTCVLMLAAALLLGTAV